MLIDLGIEEVGKLLETPDDLDEVISQAFSVNILLKI